MHSNAATVGFHHQQVYQRGAYSHVIDHPPLQFSLCFVILRMLASLKIYSRESGGHNIWESLGGFR